MKMLYPCIVLVQSLEESDRGPRIEFSARTFTWSLFSLTGG